MHAALIAVALGLAAPAPAPMPIVVAQAQPTASIDPARLAKATRLVEAVNPFEPVLAANMAGWEHGFREALKIDPTIAGLEAKHPGAIKAAMDGARPVAAAYVMDLIKNGLARKAQIIAAGLTEAEIEEAIAFYEGDVGRAFLADLNRRMGESVKAAAAEKARQYRQSGEVKLEASELQAKVAVAAMRTAEGLTPEQSLALMRFTSTAAARKLNHASGLADQEFLALVNNPPMDVKIAQTQAAQKAILAFVDGS